MYSWRLSGEYGGWGNTFHPNSLICSRVRFAVRCRKNCLFSWQSRLEYLPRQWLIYSIKLLAEKVCSYSLSKYNQFEINDWANTPPNTQNPFFFVVFTWLCCDSWLFREIHCLLYYHRENIFHIIKYLSIAPLKR